MRLISTFLCCFLLTLFTGTLTYVYIIWNSYWSKVAKMTDFEEALLNKQLQISQQGHHRFHMNNAYRNVMAAKAAVSSKSSSLTNKESEVAEQAEMKLPPDKLLMHVRHYKTQIVSQLRSAVVSAGKSVENGEIKNVYGVHYDGKRSSKLKSDKTPQELVCSAFKQIKIQTFLKGDNFFKKHQLEEFLPLDELNLLQKDPPYYDSCGVVSSAGSLLHSNLGSKIDANDFVIRFNNAPTNQYEKDVGSKTSLRIINSQVVANPSFKFLDESHLSPVRIYSKSPVLIWDPSGYNSTLDTWYGGGADFPFFQTYFSKRLMRPEDDTHLLHPHSLWSVWDWLQSESKWSLLPNPPSSGFLGIVLGMLHCKLVHVYEYVPSMRLTKKCHYYDENENLGCTIGDWHPLAAEKILALAMNVGNDTEVFAEGYLTIPGLHGIRSSCANDTQ